MAERRALHELPACARVRFAAATRGLASPVVAACSGGADSVALALLAVDAGFETIVVHVDHGLRGEGRADAHQVARVAVLLGIAFDGRAVDVQPGPNVEERARAARYAALEAARREHGASAVLVGHTADDQAETILLNLLRGAAAPGLAGMPPHRGRIVRPLLGFRRAETAALCTSAGLPVLHDPMNDDRRYRRVAVRHDVLPLLERVAGRDLVPLLVRQAAILRDESRFLDELARAAWPGASGATARDLCALPEVVARRAVRQWLGSPPPSAAEVARVLQVAAGERRGTELARGRTVRRTAGLLELRVPLANGPGSGGPG